MHLREAAIPTKIVPRASIQETVKSVSTAPKQSPVVQSVSKQIVLVVPKPNVEGVATLSVSSTINCAESANVQNQSANNAPKLVWTKGQGSVQSDSTSVPNDPQEMVIIIKPSPKSQQQSLITLNQEFRKIISGDQSENTKQEIILACRLLILFVLMYN